MSAAGSLLDQVFFPHLSEKVSYLKARNGRFVHYTTAEVAASIIEKNEVWMRNSLVMNDFSEIEHGLHCWNSAYEGPSGRRLKLAMDSIRPGLTAQLEASFHKWMPHFRNETYLTCISEHQNDEDEIGRLSMWRAYGGHSGVAIVMNNDALFSESNALAVTSAPVTYLRANEFCKHLGNVASNLSTHRGELGILEDNVLLGHLFNLFRVSVLCTKHPGFKEELEWRVIYTPGFEISRRLTHGIITVRGVPQSIYKIPLSDVPEEGLRGISLPRLINRIIIGPTQNPHVLSQAFIRLLTAAGVEDARSKVFVSDIPLRQQA